MACPPFPAWSLVDAAVRAAGLPPGFAVPPGFAAGLLPGFAALPGYAAPADGLLG
jgi:hypothetical protein